MSIKHKRNAAKADGVNDGRVQPSWWNEDHDIGPFLDAIVGLAVTPKSLPYIKDDGTGGLIALSDVARVLLSLADAPAILAALAGAPLASPALSGLPRAPTATPGDNSTQIANTAFVSSALAALVASSPATLDTLNELAAAIANDPNFATTMANALASRLRFDAVQTLTTGQRAQLISNLALAYSDLTGRPTLGSASALNAGAAPNNLVQLDGAGKLPALDGSQLTNIAATGALQFNVAQALSLANQKQARANAGVDDLNLVINPDFRINQDGYVSGVALAAGAHGHDGWKAGASGCTYTFTQLSSSTMITITAGSLIHVIANEDVEGGSYVVSHAGTAQVRAGINTASPSGGYAAAPLSFTGQTAGTVMSVEFGVGTVGKVKVEAGALPTPFVMRLFETEYRSCLRRYRKSYEYGIAPAAALTAGSHMSAGAVWTHFMGSSCRLGSPMRPGFALTIYDLAGNPGKVTILDIAGTATNNVTPNTPAYTSQQIDINMFGTGGVTNPSMLRFHWKMDARP